MSEKFTEKLGFHTESTVLLMSAVCEASGLIRQASEPRPAGDSVKSAIGRAARKVSRFMRQPMTFSRAEDIWRQEARSIRAEEMDALRAAAKREKAFHDEAAALEARLARVEAALLAIDPDFHSGTIDALRRAQRPHRKASGEVRR